MTVAIFSLVLLGAIFMGMPIAFALIVTAGALMWHLGALDWQLIALQMVNGADSFPLLAVPFFLLAGEAMNAGGLSKRLVTLGLTLVGHLRGGLGYVAIFTAILLASMSGSAVADTAALASMLLPVMRQAGYDVGRSSGLIASGGIIAPVLSPSIGYIVFGVIGGVSITRLFLTGIVPGLLLGLSLAVAWWVVSQRDKVQPMERKSWGEAGRALLDAALALGLPIIIIGGLKGGVFTPTEAAVVAAVYAVLVGAFVYRELTLPKLYEAMLMAVRTSAAVMFLVAAASVSAYLIAIANIPAEVSAMLDPFKHDKVILMAVIMLLVVIVGTALDFIPTILILTPVLMPIVKQAGIDPVYFGVLFVMNNAIGLITPPVGTVLNVVSAVGKVPLALAIKGVWPFLIAQLIVLVVLTLFPALVIVPARMLY
ncbi:TRAP transporter large permease [Methylopila sp. Yamaguchi]|uniref:TRAP transporter large permease n=1 Tax=Methylopila sp. Yamaguchi TaxID=1437817 RepID=UPI000CC05F24|nr:TRAP transporter large permease subunit [Methylopila sp. Yamaguchi]GBD50258.1 TRAP dicarboxylate transporter subunit DctM [Methylopila sp. Yamaguchi]